MWKRESILTKTRPANAVGEYEARSSGMQLGLGVALVVVVGVLFALMSTFGAPDAVPSTVPAVTQ